MKKVMISIIGKQENEGEQDSVELVTEGEYEYSPENSTLVYQESSITGMEGTVTTFNIEPGTVTLTREGTVTSQMLFRKGEKHVFLYSTPYGANTMGISTRRLSVSIDENGGHMEISYALDVDNIKISDNEFIIDIK
ncbi:MAG: DUF1934 domain-containing protein [Clostridiales bacterium]|nr:DUF1934 domain-containing protein [Clostridiales bacterium]